MTRAALALIRREWQLAVARRAELIQPLLLYALIVTLFALGAEPNSPVVKQLAPDIIWLSALLASLLGLDRLFRDELDDGTLEQWFVSDLPASWITGIKLIMHWVFAGLPLALAAPALAWMLGSPTYAGLVLALSLLLGTIVLVFVGGFASALTVGLPRAGMILPLLVLPLLCPVIIFGSGAVRTATQGWPAGAPLYFLAALAVLCLTLIPLAAAAALRNALD
jgi:heme exporter protein B